MAIDVKRTYVISPTKLDPMDEDASITLFIHVMHAKYARKNWMWLIGK